MIDVTMVGGPRNGTTFPIDSEIETYRLECVNRGAPVSVYLPNPDNPSEFIYQETEQE